MTQIVKYMCEELDKAEISCVMVNGDPWFKGIDVATVLGYARPRDAVYDHVPLKLRFNIWSKRPASVKCRQETQMS